MFTAALFMTAKKQKQLKGPPTHEWINKTWCIYPVEYYTAFKRKENLIHETTWKNFRYVILHEIREPQKY